VRTNDKGKILEFTRASLVLNRGKTFIEELLRVMGGFLIDSDLDQT
jgi:hypothetical protein